jgi:signal transduction histidine kinase
MSSVPAPNVIEFPLDRTRADLVGDQLRDAVAEERLRIARELHDVVSYSFATIKVQAGAALHLADEVPEALGEALRAIDSASKEALAEIRAILGALRSGDGAVRTVAPGVGLIDDLAASMTAAGVRTHVAICGDVRSLPPAVDLAAFRIVQESLSNVLQHEGSTTAVVRLTYEEDCITVETENSEGKALIRESHGSGHGIAGMRERVAELGGQFEAGRRPGGGFRVFARLLLFPRLS